MVSEQQIHIVDIRPIVAFLESLEYRVELNPNGEISFVGGNNGLGYMMTAYSRKDALILGLSEFLKKELGRNWHSTYDFLEQPPPAFTKEEWMNIETAIRYHEMLEKIGAGNIVNSSEDKP